VKDIRHDHKPLQPLVDDAIENGVKRTRPHYTSHGRSIENTIQNGVKETIGTLRRTKLGVDDIIQNGVKETKSDEGYLTHFTQQYKAEQTIEKGVKETKDHKLDRIISVISTIKNGVKHTKPMDEWVNSERIVDEVVKDGVKEIKTPGEDGDIVGVISFMQDNNTYSVPQLIDDVIENGVKEVKEISNFSLTSEIFKVNAKLAIRDGIKELKVWKSNRCEEHGYFEFVDGIPTYTPMVQVQDVIENGVKEIKELPDKSGELKGYGDYYHRQENWTKAHTEYVKEVIEDHYNHMGRVEGVIRNTDKDGI
jgi:predicted peroxiredoxin